MIEKKDWESTKEQFSNLLVNSIINSEIQKMVVELAEKKIAEFPVGDPMPKEVKEMVEAAK